MTTDATVVVRVKSRVLQSWQAAQEGANAFSNCAIVALMP
jgi:hypothetical protein